MESHDALPSSSLESGRGGRRKAGGRTPRGADTNRRGLRRGVRDDDAGTRRRFSRPSGAAQLLAARTPRRACTETPAARDVRAKRECGGGRSHELQRRYRRSGSAIRRISKPRTPSASKFHTCCSRLHTRSSNEEAQADRPARRRRRCFGRCTGCRGCSGSGRMSRQAVL